MTTLEPRIVAPRAAARMHPLAVTLDDDLDDEVTLVIGAPPRPTWWTEGLETSWRNVRPVVTDEWNHLVSVSHRLPDALTEEALAFGHGSRLVYPEPQAWGPTLSARLERSWSSTHDAKCPWAVVRDAVRHGWRRGASVIFPVASAWPHGLARRS